MHHHRKLPSFLALTCGAFLAGCEPTGGTGDDTTDTVIALTDTAEPDVSVTDAAEPDVSVTDTAEPDVSVTDTAEPDGSTTSCEPGDAPPTCHPPCGTDVAPVPFCENGAWTIPSDCHDTPCDIANQPSCELYNREVCCGADGSVVFARCPSPMDPICVDGSTPVRSCGGLAMTVTAVNSPCGSVDTGFPDGSMTVTVTIDNRSERAVVLDKLVVEGETMRFEDAQLDVLTEARFDCVRSSISRGDGTPRAISATLYLRDETTLEASGFATLREVHGDCDALPGPDFACSRVNAR